MQLGASRQMDNNLEEVLTNMVLRVVELFLMPVFTLGCRQFCLVKNMHKLL